MNINLCTVNQTWPIKQVLNFFDRPQAELDIRSFKKKKKKKKKKKMGHGNQRPEIELARAFMPILITSNFDDNSIKSERAGTETQFSHYKSIGASVAQLDAPSDWRPGGHGFNPRRGRQHSFVEIGYEIFSTVILSLPLIQEGQLSVSGERLCAILVNRLED